MKNDSAIEVITSEDGSHTLYVKSMDEHYHSVHGAIQESMHVFINAGFSIIEEEKIAVLEFGFGTGLNAFLTAIHVSGKDVFYHSLEKYPVNPEIISVLNYGHSFDNLYNSVFEKIHSSSWGQVAPISDSFRLLKEQCDFRDALLLQKYNLIYFDAFAPDKQPDLWKKDIFESAYSALLPGGVLVTYCAKGVVRRTMQEVGFKVERLPGPPGKREMLRATKV